MKTFLLGLVIICTGSIAQTQGPTKSGQAEFEVASIKIAKDSAANPSVQIMPGRFRVTNLPVRRLILIANKLQNFQLAGGPGWIDSERYDINATTDAANGADAMLLMLQRLIETRFQFRFHHEAKEGAVYFLTVAKSGSNLREADCAPFDPNNLPKQVTLSNDERKRQCSGITRRSGELDGNGMTMEDSTGPAFQSLAGQLSLILDRPVVNKTGIAGLFEIHLRWTQTQFAAAASPAGDSGATAPEENGPSIFTALQEQLGLRLESGKGPVGVFVIDQIERPSDN